MGQTLVSESERAMAAAAAGITIKVPCVGTYRGAQSQSTSAQEGNTPTDMAV